MRCYDSWLAGCWQCLQDKLATHFRARCLGVFGMHCGVMLLGCMFITLHGRIGWVPKCAAPGHHSIELQLQLLVTSACMPHAGWHCDSSNLGAGY